MREIKFRAWDSNKMYYPNLNDSKRSSAVILERFDLIMQYTGLKDKNGKEVYEGDIIEQGNFTNRIKDKFQIIYEPNLARFAICNDKDERAAFIFFIPFEIIGNIYENPELLNQTT